MGVQTETGIERIRKQNGGGKSLKTARDKS